MALKATATTMVTVMVGLERVWEDTWEEEEEVVLARWQGPQPEEDHLDPEGFRPPSHRQKAMPCMSKVATEPLINRWVLRPLWDPQVNR